MSVVVGHRLDERLREPPGGEHPGGGFVVGHAVGRLLGRPRRSGPPGLGLHRLEPLRVGPEQQGAAQIVEQPERERLVGPHPRPVGQHRADRGRRHRVLPVPLGHRALTRLEQAAGVHGGHRPHCREPDHGDGEGDVDNAAGEAVVGGVGQPQDPGRERRVGDQRRRQVLGRGIRLIGHPHRPHRHRRLGREPLQLLDEDVDERAPVRSLLSSQRVGPHYRTALPESSCMPRSQAVASRSSIGGA